MSTQSELARRTYRRQTRYEAILSGPDGEYLIGYTTQTNKRGLFACAQRMGEAIVGRSKMTDNDRIRLEGSGVRQVIHLNSAWSLRFSGRTERECIIAGEREAV